MNVTTKIEPRGATTGDSPLVFWDGYGLGGVYSGVLTHAISLAEALGDEGIKPIIVGENGCKRHFPEMVIERVQPSLGKLSRSKVLWSAMVNQVINRVVGDKIHIVHGLSNFNVPLNAPHSKQRRVLTIHDVIPFLDPSAVSMAYYLQFKAVLGRAVHVVDRIICVSNWTLQCLLTFFPHIEEKCIVIYNGINDKIKIDSAKSAGVAYEVLSIARYEKYKRLEMLIEISRGLPNNFSLNLVTDNRGRLVCEKLAGDLLENHKLCVYVGISREHLENLYRKSHVYLHPSLYEGFNIPAVEALIYGLPVVHCKGIGTEEIISSEVGVSLGPNENVGAWVDAVMEALQKLDTPRWKTELRSAVDKLPTWQQNAKKTKEIYMSLV